MFSRVSPVFLQRFWVFFCLKRFFDMVVLCFSGDHSKAEEKLVPMQESPRDDKSMEETMKPLSQARLLCKVFLIGFVYVDFFSG